MLLRGSAAPTATAARPSTALRAAAAVAAVVVAASILVGGLVDRLEDGAPVSFERAPRLAQLPDYGADGSDVLGYDHGERVHLTLSLRNRTPVPVHLVDVDPMPGRLGMLVAESATVDGVPVASDTGVRLGPFERVDVEVAARFDNCEYYTERAVDRYQGARVSVRTLGLTRRESVDLGRQLLVRGPTILGCPDRELDRSAKQRSEDASIRG